MPIEASSQIESRNFLGSTLSAIFPTLARLTFTDPQDPVNTFSTTRENGVRSLNAILKFGREANGDVLVSLDIGEPAPTGFVMIFEAGADTSATVLPPSFTLEHEDGRRALVYLLAGDADSIADLRRDLEPVEGDRYTLSTLMPLPFGGWILGQADEAIVKAGGRFPVLDCTVIEAAFFTHGDVSASDAGRVADTEKVEPKLCSESGPIEKYKDAELRGGSPNKEFLKKLVRVARAPSSDQTYWAVSPEMPFGDVLAQWFTTHRAHEVKDNWATTFASLLEIGEPAELKKIEAQAKWKKADNGERWPVKKLPDGFHWAHRNKNVVGAIYALGIDIDDGTSFEEACEAVEKLGYFGLLYTTHSHGSTSLDFSYSKFRKWSEREGRIVEKEELTNDDVKAFLTAEGKYKPHVIASVRNARWEQTSRGVLVFVDIDPIDKFRIVFLLENPYVPTDFKLDFAAVETQWREIVLGVGAQLGVKPDKAATDLCRLFYEPCHNPNRPDAKIAIYAGDKLLDWAKVDPVKEEKRGKGGSNAPDRFRIDDIDLRIWAKHFARAFLPTMLLDNYCDDRIRHRHNDTKFDIECPHDDGHSNSGDVADRGGFVVDAGDTGFVWACQHDSCSDRDRLDQIKKAIEDSWFGIAALIDREFSSLPDDEFATALAAFEKDNESAVKRKSKAKSSGKAVGSDFAVSLGSDGTIQFTNDAKFEIREHEDRDWLFSIEGQDENSGENWGWPVCTQFKVLRVAKDSAGGSATITIGYDTRHDGPRELTFPMGLLYERAELLKLLRSNFFPMENENGLIELFKKIDLPVNTIIVEEPGWRDGGFLNFDGTYLPAVVDDDAETDCPPPNHFILRNVPQEIVAQSGSFEGWKEGIGRIFTTDHEHLEPFQFRP